MHHGLGRIDTATGRFTSRTRSGDLPAVRGCNSARRPGARPTIAVSALAGIALVLASGQARWSGPRRPGQPLPPARGHHQAAAMV